MKLISRLARSLRKRINPTPRDLAIKRWHKDDGDNLRRYDCPLGKDSIVFDMGGFEGSWAAEIFARFVCRVEIFEPVPTFAEKIRERFSYNPALRVHTCGLAARTRVEHIALSSDASSIFIQAAGATVPIELIDVDDWFARNGVDHIDLMKINIEGGEYELLERMLDKRLVVKVGYFQIQFHDLAPDSGPRMEAIRARLAETHEALYHYAFVWDGWRLKPSVTRGNANGG